VKTFGDHLFDTAMSAAERGALGMHRGNLVSRVTGAVLEIGTGHGYQAAVLSRIASHVYTVESVPELAEQAKRNLRELGYDNITVRVGDGTQGWPEEAPFNGILATASGPSVPEVLKEQLASGGRLVMPIGAYRLGQQIVRVIRGADGSFHQEKMLDVAFVPLVGKYGWEK